MFPEYNTFCCNSKLKGSKYSKSLFKVCKELGLSYTFDFKKPLKDVKSVLFASVTLPRTITLDNALSVSIGSRLNASTISVTKTLFSGIGNFNDGSPNNVNFILFFAEIPETFRSFFIALIISPKLKCSSVLSGIAYS